MKELDLKNRCIAMSIMQMFIYLQPDNIFLDEEAKQVQIGDFGLAKLGLNNPTSTNISARSLLSKKLVATFIYRK